MQPYILALLLFFALPAMAEDHRHPIPEGELLLEDALALALAENPGLTQAGERVEMARAVLRQAKAAWYPRVSLQSGIHQRTGTIQPDWQPETRLSDSFTEYTARFQATFLLFDGFSRSARIAANKHNLNRLQALHEESRRLLKTTVQKTYYQAQLFLEMMYIARQDAAFNQSLEKDAEIRVATGTAPEADRLNFSIRTLNAVNRYLQAKDRFHLTCTLLHQLMGLDSTETGASLIPVRMETPLDSQPEIDPGQKSARAKAARPDLRALKAQILSLEERKKAVRGEYSPKVFLSTGLGYLYQDDKAPIDKEENFGYIGLGVEWELFSGGLRRGKIAETEAELRLHQARRRELELGISQEIVSLAHTLQSHWQSWQNLERAAQMAATVRDHAKKSWAAGRDSITRLNEAQTDLVAARGSAAAERLHYLITLAELESATATGTAK